MSDRILTTQVGSLSRLEALLDLMRRAEGEDCDAAALERELRDGLKRVVAPQVEAGIDFVSDGELSKPSSRAPSSATAPRESRR